MNAETPDTVASTYVRLVLEVGEHDGDYVDAYYGDPRLKEEAAKGKKPLAGIRADAEGALALLRSAPDGSNNELERLRRLYLDRQLSALLSRVALLAGRKMSFDEEAEALYDARPPAFPESHFQSLLKELDLLLLLRRLSTKVLNHRLGNTSSPFDEEHFPHHKQS